jgi:hypothetical protein
MDMKHLDPHMKAALALASRIVDINIASFPGVGNPPASQASHEADNKALKAAVADVYEGEEGRLATLIVIGQGACAMSAIQAPAKISRMIEGGELERAKPYLVFQVASMLVLPAQDYGLTPR